MAGTPKMQVKARYPHAYSVGYGGGVSWFIYEKPAKAAPRGLVARVHTIGMGVSASKAWADALRRMLAARKPANVGDKRLAEGKSA